MIQVIYLTSLISLIFLLILGYWLYQDYRTDVLREQLFKLRDDLFNEACNGKINFEDPSYGIMRNSINGFIRFGHRINIYQGILLYLTVGKDKNYINQKAFSTVLQENMKNLNIEQQELINKYLKQMNLLIARHLFLSSFSFIFLSICALIIAIPFALIIPLKEKILKYKEKLIGQLLNKLDTAALATGEI